MEQTKINTNPKIIHKILKEDGNFPNNANLPALVYQEVLGQDGDLASIIENIFEENGWEGIWHNGIFTYHHYHSEAHEVLGLYSGQVEVQLGGPNGIILTAKAGDFIIIPAGVSHKNMGATDDFACIGAYPPALSVDMKYGEAHEKPTAEQKIKEVPIPNTDPVYGENGPLEKYWRS